MQDLWPNFDEIVLEKNNSLEILRAQAKALEKKTDGKVKATFSRTQYKKENVNPFGEIVSSLSDTFVRYENIEIFESDLENKSDANSYFNKTEYKFEIYNDEFRFRVFKVVYNILYPISLVIDEGIVKEISSNMVNTQPVHSDSDLETLLEKIFNTKKLITIISNIMLKK